MGRPGSYPKTLFLIEIQTTQKSTRLAFSKTGILVFERDKVHYPTFSDYSTMSSRVFQPWLLIACRGLILHLIV